MLIECIRIREGGTKVALGNATYHFRPSDAHDGRHVAEVENPAHIKTLLGIEAYVPVDVAAGDETPADPEPEPELDGATGNDDAEGDMAADAPPPTDAANVDAITAEVEAMTEEQARARYEEVLLRKPHANMAEKTVKARLVEALTEAA